MSQVKIKTTVIGSFPKPDYLECPDWFRKNSYINKSIPDIYTKYIEQVDPEVHNHNILRATKDVMDKCCNIDIITDGEIRRENYIHYQFYSK